MQTEQEFAIINFLDYGMIKSFSESEQNTGKTWIDGKAIYQKTVDFGALPNATVKEVNHNISSLDTIIQTFCYAYSATFTEYLPIPYADSAGGTAQVQLKITPTTVKIAAGLNGSTYVCFCTLFYTKT